MISMFPELGPPDTRPGSHPKLGVGPLHDPPDQGRVLLIWVLALVGGGIGALIGRPIVCFTAAMILYWLLWLAFGDRAK
jgi:hypothetical protein